MKLVVEYSNGEYEDYVLHQYAVDTFESKEAFLSAFVTAFNEWAELKIMHDSLFETYRKADGNSRKALDDFFEQHGYTRLYELVIDGMSLSETEDYKIENGKYILIALPEVYTLDEWFEQSRPRKRIG